MPTKSHKPGPRSTLLLIALALMLGYGAAFLWQRQVSFIVDVTMQVDPTLRVVVIRQGYPSEKSCRENAVSIVKAMQQSCPECKLLQQHCLNKPSPRYHEFLKGHTIDAPLVRIPDGVLVYESTDASQALQACQEAARRMGSNATCIQAESMSATSTPAQGKN